MADIPIGTHHYDTSYAKRKCMGCAYRLFIFSFFFFWRPGFGTTSKSTQDCRKLDPGEICCFHQADLGEYLREEATLI
jgi:hypothetical protein